MSGRAGDENSALARLAAALHPLDPHTDRVLAASDALALEIVHLARDHGVSALLAHALDRGGRLEALPTSARDVLRRHLLDAGLRRAVIDRGLASASAALNAAGVPFLVLKGAALAGLVYPDPLLRPMTDVDLLVQPRDLDRSLAALADGRFETPPAAERAFWRDAYYNLPTRADGGAGAVVEVHWSLAQSTRQRPDIEGVFARARRRTHQGLDLLAPGPADLLLHQALHHSYHYFEPKLIWIYDLALLHQAAPPVAEAIDRAHAWGMATPLALSVLQVDKAFPGAAHPELLAFAQRSAPARIIRGLFGSRASVALIGGWDRRWRQLALAAAMLDSPAAVFAPTASWLRRALRHGDRAGRKRRPASPRPRRRGRRTMRRREQGDLSPFLLRAGPPLAALVIRSLRRTLRLRVHGREILEHFAAEGQRYVHVCWHAHILTMVYSYIGPELVFMISRHRDGELTGRIVQRFGYAPAYGSTTEGGSMALRRMFRAVRGGSDIGFTPDGPRGPARKVKPGCIAAAQHLGIPIVPVSMAASRAWILNNWDRFVIPKPGAHVLLAYGAPLAVAPDEAIDAAAARLEQAMADLERFAAVHAGDRAVGVRV